MSTNLYEIFRTRYPTRVPIIIKPSRPSDTIPNIPTQWAVEKESSVARFLHKFRERAVLNKSEAIFIFTKNSTLIQPTLLIEEVWEAHKGQDGILHLVYAKENTFGRQ